MMDDIKKKKKKKSSPDDFRISHIEGEAQDFDVSKDLNVGPENDADPENDGDAVLYERHVREKNYIDENESFENEPADENVSDENASFKNESSTGRYYKEKHLEVSQDEYDQMPDIGDRVKMHFSNFVQLVASHDFSKIVEKKGDEEIILSADLLAELASAHEEEGPNRMPIVFIVGIVLGVAVTYVLLRT